MLFEIIFYFSGLNLKDSSSVESEQIKAQLDFIFTDEVKFLRSHCVNGP